MSRITKNKQKDKLHGINPHCSSCGVLTWLPPKNNMRGQKKLTKEQIDSMATIGHAYSKWDTRRYTASPHEKKHILLCHKCNVAAGRMDELSVPLGERRKRSGRSNSNNSFES